MYRFIQLVAFTAISFFSYAQQSVTWGDEFKLKKGATGINVVYSDESGVYVQEEHVVLSSYFLVGASYRGSATLVKLNTRLQEVYRNDFNKELRGKTFEVFFALRNKLIIVASDYNKGDKTLTVMAAEIDKKTGEMTESWKTLASFQKDEKKEQIDFKIIPNADSTGMVIISSTTGFEKNTYRVQEFDSKLKPSSKPATITNEFEAKTYQLEDVLYTTDKKIVLVGRVFEYREGKKKKGKFLDFLKYNIRTYNEQGKQLFEINTTINSKWLNATKLMLGEGKELVLAAFYSKEKRGTTSGLLVQRINTTTGTAISTTEKEINYSLLTGENTSVDDDDDDDKEDRAERKERKELEKFKDEGEGFSRYMKFRNIFYTADHGLILLAENYNQYSFTRQSYKPGMGTSPGGWTYEEYAAYNCGEVLMCKIDANNEIAWLQMLPKEQHEVIRGPQGISSASASFAFTSFFDTGIRPFYAGFSAFQLNNKIHLLFNDHSKNANVLQAGQKASRALVFRKTDCFIVTLDERTGQTNRKVLFSNVGIPTAMPRLASVVNQEMYLIGRTDRTLGKIKLVVGKITTK